MMLHLANLTLRLYKDELGLASDNMSPVRFWMRSLPGTGWLVTIAASRAWAVARWGGVRGWVIFSLWMLISELRPGSVTSTKGRSCCLHLDLVLVLAADKRGLLQVVARLVWGLQWWQTLKGPSLLLRSATSWDANGTYPWHSCRWPDVDRCIGGWAGASGE